MRTNHHKRLLRWQTIVLALILGLGLVILTLIPVGVSSQRIPVASAHAILVRSKPAANAALHSSPSQVFLWFDDKLVPANSHVTVQNAAGHEVDKRDSHVSASNLREMIVSVPQLSAGTYTVIWIAQSSDDGHVTNGSFRFRIISSGITVPPPTAPGSLTGGGHRGANGVLLDGPTIVQTLATWLALLCMTVWVGSVIWETWVLAPGAQSDPDLTAASVSAARRFQQLAPYVLGTLFVADIAIVVAEAAELAGNWSGAVTPSLLETILFGSWFGAFWWMRQVIVLAALSLRRLALRRGWSPWQKEQETHTGSDYPAVPDWWRAVLKTFQAIPRVPSHLLAGWQRRTRLGRGEILLAGLLLVAFAFSGHAAAVPASAFGYAVSVDIIHLLGDTTWVGGLTYIAFVLTPVLSVLRTRQRARVLALGLPAFSALAATSAFVLAATGPLNATYHMTSWQQFLTTPYGWVLAVKIEWFLLMVAMSAYHAFFLRPRLAHALATAPGANMASQSELVLAEVDSPREAGAQEMRNSAVYTGEISGSHDDASISEEAQQLAQRIEGWLRREAFLAVGVLFCAALLSAFAGTLVPA